MSTMQQALIEVGFKPRLRTLRRAAERERLTLAPFVDGVTAPITKVRNIQVQKAGTHYRARFEGSASSIFSDNNTPSNISRKLEYFDGGK